MNHILIAIMILASHDQIRVTKQDFKCITLFIERSVKGFLFFCKANLAFLSDRETTLSLSL